MKDWSVWCVWRQISTDENGTHIFACNTECGTACDRRLCWRKKVFVAWATTEEEFAITVGSVGEDFAFTRLEE